MTRIEHRTRIDGWVVPARPLTVRLLAEDEDRPRRSLDEFGRFELPDAPSGLARLAFLDDTPPRTDRGSHHPSGSEVAMSRPLPRPTRPDLRQSAATSRQSALSTQREPFVPPRRSSTRSTVASSTPGPHWRSRACGRVAPSTSDRACSSRAADPTEVIGASEVAETLGWEARSTATRRARRQPASGGIPAWCGWTWRAGREGHDRPRRLGAAAARARHVRRRGMRRVGLDHIVLVRSIDANPFHSPSPFHHQPVPPPTLRGGSSAISSYGVPGSGGRQPISYAGPAPVRRDDERIVGRRPVVATLDTGCGEHDWLKNVVKPGPGIDGGQSATSTTRPTPRSGSTRSAPSTAASTRWPVTAPSSRG